MKKRTVWLLPVSLTLAGLGAFAWLGGHAALAGGEPAMAPHSVDPEYAFGFQFVPKYDEVAKRGSWQGSRDRGIAMHHDLGVEVSREGFIWRQYEPNQNSHPNLADFDDVADRLDRADIAIEAMVTETPLWASTAPHPDAKNPASYKSAPPKGLYEPIFTDGTDQPAPGKRLNPKNTWAAGLGHMVRRYSDQVRYWQIWNEPDYPKGDQAADYSDGRRSWNGSVDDYVRLLKVGHTVVKWADPKAQVVTGGIGFGSYLQAMLDRGAGAYFDQLDFHAYGWPGSDAALAQYQKVHDEMQAVLVKNGLDDKGLICSETGYTALQPEVQAAYIAKLYPTAIALGVESTMYYANVNPSWKNMGLVDWRTMSQRTQGYWAYKNAAAALRDARMVTPLKLRDVKGYRFDRDGRSSVFVLWAPNRAPNNALAATLSLPPGKWSLRDCLGRPIGACSGTARLKLSASPVWLDNDVQRAYAPMRPNPPLARPGLPIESAIADSAAEDAGSPEAAIDTDSDSHWSNGTFKEPSAWLRVALKQPASVRELKLKTGPTPEGTWFDVEVSLDGRRYAPVATNQRLSSWKMESIAFSHPVQARYIRLTWRNPDRRPAHFSVFEVEAH